MTRICLGLLFLAMANTSKGQIKALTETGDEVILYGNGTWKYLQPVNRRLRDSLNSLATNPLSFARTAGQTFLVKSKVLNSGVFLNPSKWTFFYETDNAENLEYRFRLKSADGFALMLTEKVPIALENLCEIALKNARERSVDAHVIHAEYRIVNDKKVVCLQIEATKMGINLMYLGYYYSNENGTLQLVAYTTDKFFKRLQGELESFLNGLVELPE